jgi:hypothetical protein
MAQEAKCRRTAEGTALIPSHGSRLPTAVANHPGRNA